VAKSKSWEKRGRVKVGDQALVDGIQQDLDTLEVLADAYDAGKFTVAPAMSTAVLNIFNVQIRSVVEARGKLAFPTPLEVTNQTNLLETHRLICMRSTSDPATLTFIPSARSENGTAHQGFKTWWENEPIYIAGAAEPGAPEGFIPNQGKEVPGEKREKRTRMQFCTDLRNTVGSHKDSETTAVIHDLRKTYLAGIVMDWEHKDGSVSSTDDGSMKILNTPADAVMRQIAEEVLIAYGRGGRVITGK